MKIKTLRGKILDLSNVIERHGNKPAVGNAKLNARGDKLGKGGKIIKTHKQITAEYNQASPKAVKNVPLHELQNEVFSPAEALRANPAIQQKKRKITDAD